MFRLNSFLSREGFETCFEISNWPSCLGTWMKFSFGNVSALDR